jgi:hypothetical protein
MLLAAIYNTPAVPNQNSVSSGFILYQIYLVVIILKAYRVYYILRSFPEKQQIRNIKKKKETKSDPKAYRKQLLNQIPRNHCLQGVDIEA